MLDLAQLQKRIYQNKLAKRFNVKDIPLEFAYTYGELGEAFDAYLKKKKDLGEELADVVIYLLGLAEILKINLEKEILRKVEINAKRKFVHKNGVLLCVNKKKRGK